MDITKTALDVEHLEVLGIIDSEISSKQSELDQLYTAYVSKMAEIEQIKEKIRPFKIKMAELNELQAGIASRKSRVKYFPQFATKNFDCSKDGEFIKFAKESLNG